MIGTSIIALGALQSCVDNDYDLNKDMNLVVNVGGGQLSVPGSSTEQFSLKNYSTLILNHRFSRPTKPLPIYMD